MKNRDIAEKIYEDLNKRGAGLGNASISIIETSLDNLDKTENFDTNGIKIKLTSTELYREFLKQKEK